MAEERRKRREYMISSKAQQVEDQMMTTSTMGNDQKQQRSGSIYSVTSGTTPMDRTPNGKTYQEDSTSKSAKSSKQYEEVKYRETEEDDMTVSQEGDTSIVSKRASQRKKKRSIFKE